MPCRVYSAALQGLSAELIEVETAVSAGLRSFNIVGLPDKAIKEAKERVSSAIRTVGLLPPHHQRKRVVINLAPADLKKEGSLYDLPIALGYLLSSGQIRFSPQKKIILGELALDGKVKPIKGAFSFAFLCQEQGFEEIILPFENAREAALINTFSKKNLFKITPVKHLKQAIRYLEKREIIPSFSLKQENWAQAPSNFEVELGWVKGQEHTKRGLTIAAAGGHNLMMQGPPGTGKTLLARAVVSILPPLSPEESLELTKIYSAAGVLSQENPLLTHPPFRAPHHTTSEAALIGGGSPPQPGEITLAHRGVLFLDEFPEFHRDVLESLRQPIEQGKITVQRAKARHTFPAKFMLLAAANPCPCGYKNDPQNECTCTNSQIAAYRRKLSGPLMDRIDLFCWVGAVKYEDLVAPQQNKETQKIQEKVKQARFRQRERFKKEPIFTNSEMGLKQIKEFCHIDNHSQAFLKKYVNKGKLSARGYHRVLKVARTIADLENSSKILSTHIQEALSYRQEKIGVG